MILQKATINSTLLTNLVFAFFPISFISGNFIINLNLLLFCCLGIFHLRSKILKTKYNYTIKIIFLFFFIIFFSTSISFAKSLYIDGYEYNNLFKLIKSITFFRFFLMLVITYLLVQLDILNFKYFFISAAFFPVLISLDVIYQYFFDFNMIGLEGFNDHVNPIGRYNTSFFGEELIAGNYIKSLSFFSIFFLTFRYKNKYTIRFILTTVTICILGFGIIVSGNRMPIILFLLGLLLIFFFKDNLRKIILASFISLLIIFYFVLSVDKKRYYDYSSFYGNAKHELVLMYNYFTNNQKNNKPKMKLEEKKQILKHDFEHFWIYYPGLTSGNVDLLYTDKMKLEEKKQVTKHDFDLFWIYYPGQVSGHVELFYTARDLWEKNKIFGNGIKSFRVDCVRLEAHTKNRLCSSHPHNYYLEILVETGAAGLFIVSVIGLLFVIFIFKNFKSLRENNKENLILLAATISLFLETFPIRPTGSIFTTHNATYLVLIASIILSHNKLSSTENFG